MKREHLYFKIQDIYKIIPIILLSIIMILSLCACKKKISSTEPVNGNSANKSTISASTETNSVKAASESTSAKTTSKTATESNELLGKWEGTYTIKELPDIDDIQGISKETKKIIKDKLNMEYKLDLYIDKGDEGSGFSGDIARFLLYSFTVENNTSEFPALPCTVNNGAFSTAQIDVNFPVFKGMLSKENGKLILKGTLTITAGLKMTAEWQVSKASGG